jgi:hypothetical protein
VQSLLGHGGGGHWDDLAYVVWCDFPKLFGVGFFRLQYVP